MRRPRATKPLAEKLCAIRLWKNMTQGEILQIVYPEADEDHRAFVSQWENASREPRREVLIRYAQLAGITLEELLLDDIALPEQITYNTRRYNGDIGKKRVIVAEETPISREDQLSADYQQTVKKILDSQTNETISKESANSAPTTQANPQTEKGEKKIDLSTSDETPDGVPVKEVIANQQFSSLSLVIGGEPTEPITLELSIETLDELHDLHLNLLSQLPRRLRNSLTIDGIVDFCINALVDQHNYYKSESIIFEHLRLHINSSE